MYIYNLCAYQWGGLCVVGCGLDATAARRHATRHCHAQKTNKKVRTSRIDRMIGGHHAQKTESATLGTPRMDETIRAQRYNV